MGPLLRTQLPERPFKLDAELSRGKGSGPRPTLADELAGWGRMGGVQETGISSTQQQATCVVEGYTQRYG